MNIQRYFSEFIGTGFLFAAVVGSGIMGQNLSPNNDGVILLVNTIATVFALYFLIVSFQKYSANFNPVVSMVMFLNNILSLKDLIIYVFLQIAGAVLGVLLINYLFGLDVIQFSVNQRSGANIFVSEVFATFGLVLIILLSSSKNTASSVAAYIGAAYWFTSSTSFANPAASISRMFSDTFAGISPENVFLFCVAQCIGGILAFVIYRLIYFK
mgnify:FL=1